MNVACLHLTLALASTVFSATEIGKDKLYDCSANCLYLICSLTNNRISYDRCLGLLPITDKGSSLLEVNNALKQCGYETKPIVIETEDLTKVQTPSVVLYLSRNKARAIGHYIVLIPNGNKISVYDYPKDIVTYTKEFLISLLKQNGINEINIIMCKPTRGQQGSRLPQNVISIERDIVFEGFDGPLLGSLDFGKQPEATRLVCNFKLINNSLMTIELKDLKGDCQCTEIRADRTRIEPGQFCNILVEVSLREKYKNIAVRGQGKIKKLNGTKSTEILILISGYSEPRVLCDPQKIDFKKVKSNSGIRTIKGVKLLKTRYTKNHKVHKKSHN